ncbi:MAG TPA: hypothetical protein VK177_05785 [Flavobacteriales bacterium]|nr:hypothetical protein [Flavobacteriales bacterium]
MSTVIYLNTGKAQMTHTSVSLIQAWHVWNKENNQYMSIGYSGIQIKMLFDKDFYIVEPPPKWCLGFTFMLDFHGLDRKKYTENINLPSDLRDRASGYNDYVLVGPLICYRKKKGNLNLSYGAGFGLCFGFKRAFEETYEPADSVASGYNFAHVQCFKRKQGFSPGIFAITYTDVTYYFVNDPHGKFGITVGLNMCYRTAPIYSTYRFIPDTGSEFKEDYKETISSFGIGGLIGLTVYF